MKTIRPAPFPSDPYVDSVDVLAKAVRAARTQARLAMADAALAANVALQTLVDVGAGRSRTLTPRGAWMTKA